jgi:type III restriction enzyme
MVKYFSTIVDNFKQHYDDVALIRNEKHFALYSFETGEKFEPDYLLFLKLKHQWLFLNVFIEPKGEHLVQSDKWKEVFLKSLKDKSIIEIIINNHKYIVYGLCFFNKNERLEHFKKEIKEIMEMEYIKSLIKYKTSS